MALISEKNVKYILKLNENIEMRFLNFGFERRDFLTNNIKNIVLEFLENNKKRILKVLYSRVINKNFFEFFNDLKKTFDCKLILYVTCFVEIDCLKFFIEIDEIEFEKYNISIQPFQLRFESFKVEYDIQTKAKIMMELI